MQTHSGISISQSVLIGLVCSLALSACDQPAQQTPVETKPVAKQAAIQVDAEAVLASATLYAYTQLSEALNQAQILDSVVTSFLHHPNPLSLEECQQSWRRSYQAYLKVAYFYQVPRFEQPQYKEENRTYRNLHHLIDSWPIEGGYIDYLPGYPLTGIVNDLTLKISESSLLDQHGFSDINYASVGFHPIEFLLFGEGGQRSAKDFVPKENSIEVVNLDADGHNHRTGSHPESETEHDDAAMSTSTKPLMEPQNHSRRREYLRILTALLVKHLQQLVDRWDPANGYYARQWQQQPPQQSLVLLYQAMVNHVQAQLWDMHIQPAITKENLYDLRSPYSADDLDNWSALVSGVQQLWLSEYSFAHEIGKQDAQNQQQILSAFDALTTHLQQIPEDALTKPLAERKAALMPLQEKTLALLQSLYVGAQLIQVPLAPLPLSTQ